MIQQFVNRVSETEALEREYNRKRASLAVVYGRRRVGKTELLLHYLEKKGGIYFLCDRRGYKENLKEFQKVAGEVLENSLFERADFETWQEMFEELTQVMGENRVVVIDEYPYLIEEGANEEFQKIWDTILSKSGIFLVLVGSSIGMMEKKVLAHGAPLYGRRNMQLKVKKFCWEELKHFFPKYTVEQLIETYAVLDGLPLYLEQFSGSKNIYQNIEENYLRKDAFLYAEAKFLLREEFREPRRYFKILHAISSGKRKYGEIADATFMEKSALSKYLSSLLELHIITEDRPFSTEKKRLNRYKLSDNYLQFWFRYIFPNKQLVEMERKKELIEVINDTFSEYVSTIFEDVVKDILLRHGPWRDASAWWDRKGENEIDIIAVDPEASHTLFTEVKWTNKKIGWKTVQKLMGKSELPKVDPITEKKYLVVSKAGFTSTCLEKMDAEGVSHWDLNDIERMIWNETLMQKSK